MTATAVPERWLPIPSYEGLYEVSDHGRVRSLDRRVTSGRRTRFQAGRVLSGARGRVRHPHRRVPLSREGATKDFYVHRLVLEVFVGPCPPGMEACHNDGDPTNNHLGNLRWDTHFENVQDIARHGTNFQRQKTHCPRGHPLEVPNLRRDFLVNRGSRNCRACHRASAGLSAARKRGRVDFDVQVESDAHYARIMAAANEVAA